MKKYEGINYGFRPDSYWVDKTIRQSILRDIKGTERRKLIDEALKNGRFDKVEDALVGAELQSGLRDRLGSIHPHFMGGEYLPGYDDGETEIGRIELQSTTSDVISIRARVEGEEIRYRVVDEYNGKFSLACESSKRPFSLGEFIEFIEGTELNELYGPISTAYNASNAEYHESREELRYFTSLSSDIYFDLNEHYENVFEDWAAAENE